MSKLATVRTALQSNANIQIVAAEEFTYFPNPNGYWTHTVDFIVAPNNGIYSAKELQEFMRNLVPGLQPTSVDRFHDWDTSMDFGKLYFDEDLGHEIIRHELTLIESDFLPAGAIENGKAFFEEKRKIRRRIWVRLYPDQEIAMLRNHYTSRISRADLNSFKSRGRKLRFIGRISKAVTG